MSVSLWGRIENDLVTFNESERDFYTTRKNRKRFFFSVRVRGVFLRKFTTC